MEVKLTETPEAFDLPEWATLARIDPHRHLFSLPQWHRAWWDEFGADKRLVVLTFLDPDPVAVVPLMVDTSPNPGRIRFLGGDDLTDYLGPVVARAELFRPVAHSLLEFLVGELDDWRYFEAKCMPVPFGFADWLAEAADQLGLTYSVKQHELSLVLPLPRTFDEYLGSLDNKKRHELRRKIRRFEREQPDARLVRAPSADLDSALEEFIDMHRGSEGLKGKFFLPQRATFFRRLAAALGPDELIALDFLKTSSGQNLASTFSFVWEDRLYLYNSAYDQEFRHISPGLVLVARLIETSIEQGLHTFDFLRGMERYKFDLGAQPLPLHSVTVKRPREGPA